MDWHDFGRESLTLTRLLVAVWAIVTSLEWIAIRSSFNPGEILDRRVMSLRQNGALLEFVWSHFSLAQVATMRLAVASVLAIWPEPAVVAISALLLLFFSTLIAAQAGYGGDGSDQMGNVALIGLTLLGTGLSNDLWGVWFAGVLVCGGQLTISYFVSGFSKWLSRIWRSGAALPGVMGTHTYGHAWATKVISGRQWLALLICWTIFVTETFFPVSLMLPPDVFIYVLSGFLAFHFINALFMGLNSFVWSFAATYPSVLILNHYIHSLVS